MSFDALIKFMSACERLKCELRNHVTSSGRKESVAEHSWRLAMLVFACAEQLDKPICVEKAVKMALVHDLGEVFAGDRHFLDLEEGFGGAEDRMAEEKAAIADVSALIGGVVGKEIEQLWLEFEERKTYEARVVKALDKLEAHMQANEGSADKWSDREIACLFGFFDQFCSFDNFLSGLQRTLAEASYEKFEKIGVSRDELRRRAAPYLR